MEIRRDDYLEEIKAVMHNGLVKVITGIRRCGKSYFLFTIFRNYLKSLGVAECQTQFPADGAHASDGECHILRALQTWVCR